MTSALAYRGLEDASCLSDRARLASWVFGAAGAALLWRRRGTTRPEWATAGVLLLGATWLWPTAEAHALLLPFRVALLAGACVEPRA